MTIDRILAALPTSTTDGTSDEPDHAARLRDRLLTVDAIDRMPPPEPLIDGILVANTTAALTGPSGHRKSFVALDWAHCVTTATWWHGHAVKQGRVLYVVGEGVAGLGARNRAWREHNRVYTVNDLMFLGQAVNITSGAWVDALIEVALELGVVLIVFDTLARCIVGADENSAKDIGHVVDHLDRIKRNTRATVLVVHHDPKSGGALRGSSALEGSLDTVIQCTSEGDIVTLKNTKQKDLAEFEPIRLQAVETAGSMALSYCQIGLAVTTANEGQLLGEIGSTAGSDGLSTTALLKLTELPERTFYRTLKALREKGLVANVGSDRQPRYVAATGGEQ